MAGRVGFVDRLLNAPLGVALLGYLEGEWRNDVHWWDVPTDSEPAAVAAAVAAIRDRSLGELLRTAVDVGGRVGRWTPDAPTQVAWAYRRAAERRPIAEVIDEHFGEALHQPIDLDNQQCWTDRAVPVPWTGAGRFSAFDRVYGAGQFTWAGMWTVTDPPEQTHADLATAWELFHRPVHRWRMPVRPDARVYEIHGPQDWAQLVMDHVVVAGKGGESWELPSVDQDRGQLHNLLAIGGQRGARSAMRHQLVPDWASVATQFDGVHLSWAGYLTTEGCVTDLAGGDVTMLRYWSSERTHWLRDVFGEPEPLDPPMTELS